MLYAYCLASHAEMKPVAMSFFWWIWIGTSYVVRLRARYQTYKFLTWCKFCSLFFHQDGATPLFKASHKGHFEVVQELLKYRPNLGLLQVIFQFHYLLTKCKLSTWRRITISRLSISIEKLVLSVPIGGKQYKQTNGAFVLLKLITRDVEECLLTH